MIADPLDISGVYERYRPAILAALHGAVPTDAAVAEIYDLLRYHLGWLDERFQPTAARSGKRLRPTFCLLSCEAAGADYRRALPAAAALELLHNFSLIHDDVEDRGTERWGRPTVMARWGDALAINAGDAMLILSGLALLDGDVSVGPRETLRMLRVLNETCLRLTEGQHLDISRERDLAMTPEQYQEIIVRKTAALLGCSCQLGALAAGAEEKRAAAFREFGTQIGIAFQIQDDILGIWGDPAITGKPAAADVRGHKITLPVIAALARAEPSVAARIAAVYQADDPEDAAVAGVVGYLDRLGVRAQSEAAAEAAVNRGLAALTDAHPVRPHGEELRAIAFSLLGRSS
ncbi:MAG TPA: polyprenyl synthetase family protein [Chloroflexota bacterium]|nr:polyprenyl synthetase family protein [Chloroflexota bacterium]